MTGKEWIAIIVIAISCVNTSVYIRAVLKREIKAHAFSWIIWGFNQLIVGVAQLVAGGGAGAWPTLFCGALCLIVAVLAVFYHGERNITRGDWIAFVFAFAAIPLWLVTKNPLWASSLVTLIDVIAFYPTFRKSYGKPYEENFFLFSTGTISYALSICALESYSLTTAIYPATMVVVQGAFVLMIAWRRRVLGVIN